MSYKSKEAQRKASLSWYYRSGRNPDRVERARLYASNRRETRRKELFRILGDKCKDCGNTDKRVLEFDHVIPRNGNGKQAISALLGGSWETLIKEAKLCDLVCANCHRIRTRERYDRKEFNKPYANKDSP